MSRSAPPHHTLSEPTVDAKSHWERIYRTKAPEQTSWFEPEATLSLTLVQRIAPTRDEAIIDVGAGA